MFQFNKFFLALFPFSISFPLSPSFLLYCLFISPPPPHFPLNVYPCNSSCAQSHSYSKHICSVRCLNTLHTSANFLNICEGHKLILNLLIPNPSCSFFSPPYPPVPMFPFLLCSTNMHVSTPSLSLSYSPIPLTYILVF